MLRPRRRFDRDVGCRNRDDARFIAEGEMEDLTPPLARAIMDVRWSIASGRSMKDAFQSYLDRHHDPLASILREHWVLRCSSAGHRPPRPLRTHFQRAFWDLVQRGCSGQPSLEALIALESEVESAARAELDDFLATLPFKVLIPLLLFQFPAYLLLLLGPLLRELERQLGGG